METLGWLIPLVIIVVLGIGAIVAQIKEPWSDGIDDDGSEFIS